MLILRPPTLSLGPILLLLLLAVAGSANPGPVLFWYDDIEGDVSSWATADLTAGEAPHFHWDTYLAQEGYSWWCGTFDYDANGGYGNGWDDRLVLPPISVNPVVVENVSWGEIKSRYRESSGRNGDNDGRDAAMPVLTFAFRHDSEIGYDYTYVQAESMGVYVSLNRGYDGVQDWTDLGHYGFDLSSYDDPLNIRFRFVSDGAWSDEDGDYMSVGGAFHVDNVKVYDFITGDVLFYDSEPGGDEGECVPSVPETAGDYWHVIDRPCPAFSDPHSWWCGDDADTSLVPPNLQNVLFTPLIDITGGFACTAKFAMHFAVPTVDNDYVSMYVTADGGANYYSIGGWWGDFGECDGWGSTAMNVGFDMTQFDYPGPYTYGGFAWVMNTTDNGCGPGGAGDAGVMIDDVWFASGGTWDMLPVAEGGAGWGSSESVKLIPEERYDRRF